MPQKQHLRICPPQLVQLSSSASALFKFKCSVLGVRTSFLFWAPPPGDNCEPDLALSDSTPTKWSTMSSGYPALSDERSTPPPFRAFQAMRSWHACFCPRERHPLSPLSTCVRMSVALSKCSENSAAAPLVLLYYALLRCSGRQGPPSRNQEPHKLLCDSQNASHNHLTCGIKVSQPMRGSLEALL